MIITCNKQVKSLRGLHGSVRPDLTTRVPGCARRGPDRARLQGPGAHGGDGGHAGRLGRFINAEDAVWLGGVHANPDDERVQRIFRSHRNDLEALLPFLIVGSVYLASGASSAAGIAYCGAFRLACFAHTFAYLFRRPRLRRDAFALAWLTNFAMGSHGLWALFTS
jgi:hypothetical protein